MKLLKNFVKDVLGKSQKKLTKEFLVKLFMGIPKETPEESSEKDFPEELLQGFQEQILRKVLKKTL